MLTTFDADDHVVRALRDGASGFLLKHTPPAEIVDAVHKVAAGDHMLSPSVTAQLIARLGDDEPEPAHVLHAQSVASTLTDREREVAIAVGEGKVNAQIAEELYLSVATVKAHVSRLLDQARGRQPGADRDPGPRRRAALTWTARIAARKRPSLSGKVVIDP